MGPHDVKADILFTMDIPVAKNKTQKRNIAQDSYEESEIGSEDGSETDELSSEVNDALLFDADVEDIVPGTFVSFMYSGLTPGGKPFNPQVSVSFLFSFLFFVFEIMQIYTIRNDILSWEQLLSGKNLEIHASKSTHDI